MSHFEFDCEKLKHEGEFNASALQYMANKEKIDIKGLFEDYNQRLTSFYEWLMPAIENQLPLSVQDYRRCIRLWDANMVRSAFGLIFLQIVKPTTDLYSHLPKFFTTEEMMEINALPHQSREQVDHIIFLYDKYNACDDVMRQKIYGAFKGIT